MKDENAGKFIIGTGILLLLMIFTYHITVLTKLFFLMEILYLLVVFALITTGFYIIFRKRFQGRFEELKKELYNLTPDEIKVYDLIKKKIPLRKICKKTRIPKIKVKKILDNIQEKGLVKISNKGQIKILE
ncbi:MAG: hypothetical protein GON13_02710 [Nanoarchaeota archaeon]|nr:hypothetical protein [Nanoarchaeota archaeon]